MRPANPGETAQSRRWELVVGHGRITGYTKAPRRARRAGWATVLVGLLGIGVSVVGLVPPPTASADDPAQLGIVKTANVTGPVPVDTPFSFTINYSCSSLTVPCVDAKISDVIPPELEFVSNTATSHPSNITYTPGTKTLDVVFTQNVGGGQIGLNPGTTGNLDVVVKFPSGTANGVTATNCATMTASNASQVQGCDDATSFVPQTYDVDLSKAFTAPQTGIDATHGVAGTGPTTTIALSAKVTGNVPATSVLVSDPSDGTNPFDSFDLQSFQAVALPPGVQATIEVTTDGSTWVPLAGGPYSNGQTPTLSGSDPPAAAIVGVRARYEASVPGGTVPVNQNLVVKFTVKLRDTLRSAPGTKVPAGVVSNCSKVEGSWAGQPDVSVSQRCADYNVVARTPTAGGSKSFSPSSLVQMSGGSTALTLTGTNASNVPANQVVILDPTNGTTPFNYFNLTSFGPVALSGGATGLLIEVSTAGAGGPWTALNGGTPYGNGANPSFVGTGVAPSDVVAVRLTFSGSIAPTTSLSQVLNLTLRDQTRNAPVIDVPAQVYDPMNCESVDVLTNDGNATKNQICAPFTVTPRSVALDGAKSFNPTSGVAQSDPQTVMSISGKNAAASNAPITNLVVTDPGSASTAFDYFDFVSFGAITVPAGTTWSVEVWNGSAWVLSPGGPYSNGQTPTLPGSVSAGQVQGVRYTLLTGTLAPNQGIATSVRLQLRDTQRSNGAVIGGGLTIVNRVDVESTGVTKVTRTASYTTIGANPGTPGITKTFGTNPVVAGTGATTLVTLTGRNNANLPVSTLEIEDQSTSAFWTYFDFQSFSSMSGMPAGVTVKVSVFDTTTSTWVQNPTAYSNGQTPALPGGVSAGDVSGVRFTYSGSIPVAQSLTGRFTAKLRNTTRVTNVPITGPNTVADCASTTYSGTLIPSTSFTTPNPCPTITISAVTYNVYRDKKWAPATAVVNSDAQSTITLETRNRSNVGIDQIEVVDPGAGSTAPFDTFDLVSFGAVTLPTNVRVKVEVSTVGTGGPWTALSSGTLWSNGQTPAFGGGDPAPGQVVAIRFVLTATAGNTIPISTGTSNPTNRMITPFTVQLRDTLRSSGNPVVAGSVTDCIDVTSTPSGGLQGGQPCAIYTIQAESPGVSDGKSWSPGSGNRDQLPASTITLTARNSGNVSANSLTIQDPATVGVPPLAANAFDAIQLTGFGSLTFPTGADRVQLDVLTADGTWHTGAPAPSLPSIGSLPDGVAAVDVVGVRITFTKSGGGLLPPEPNSGANAVVLLNVKLRPKLLSTGQQVPLGAINNCMNASVVTPFGNATAQDKCASYTVNAGALTLAPKKTLDPPTPTTFNPGDSVIFRLQLKNTGTRNWNAPVLVDQFPATLQFDQFTPFPGGQFEFDPNGSSLTSQPALVVGPNQVTFSWGAGDFLAPGETAFLDLALKVAPGTPAGTQITNAYGISEPGGDFNCSPGASASTTFVPGQKFCTDDETISVKESRGLSSLKEVKGDPGTTPTNIVVPGDPCPDNGGYTRYPCVAHTTINSTFPYRLTVSNSGNVPMERAIVIDKLPRVGDTGVIVNQPRGTAWTPTLTTPVVVTGLPAGATATVYYSTSANPCITPLTGGAWCGDWTTSFLGAATKSVGIEVTYAADKMDPGEGFQLDWSMTAPSGSPTDGSIAWNSFAFTGKPIDQPDLLLPAEPRKVGIVLDNPSLKVKKVTDPEDAAGTFEFTLTAVPPTPAVDPPATRTVTTPGQSETDPWTNLVPGGTYTLTETAQSDWESGAFTCVDTSNDDAPVPITAQGVITLPAGSDVVCRITNTKRPTIEVEKVSVGGDGQFGFTLTGPEGFDPQTKQVTTSGGTGSADFTPPFQPGKTYTMSESSAPAGWVSVFTGCTGATDVVPVTVDGAPGVKFTAPPAGTVSCSFTNTKRPTVKVSKSSTGGNGTFEFELEGVDGAGGGSKQDVATAPNGSGSYTWDGGLTPGGTYTLTETPASGWVSDFVSCTGATQVSEIANGVQFVAPAGASVDCSFTNTKRPTVKVSKTTVGGNGTFDFTLAGPSGGSTQQLDTSVGSTLAWDQGLTPGGVYTLTEASAGPDWVSAFVSCTNAPDATPVAGGVTFTAGAGAQIDCTFTNHKRPTVKVSKTSSGGNGIFAFTLTGVDGATGGDTQNVDTAPSGTGSATWNTGLTPGGTYQLTEAPGAEWAATFEGCDGAQSVTVIANGVQFVAPSGASVKCSFTNAKRPSVKVLKSSVGGDGTFQFTLTGPGGSAKDVTTAGGSGSASWGPDGLVPGADYALSETTDSAWTSVFVSCVNTATVPASPIGSALDEGVGVSLPDLPAGAVVECSFTNTKRPTVKVSKSSTGGNGTFEFELEGVDGAGGGSKQDVATAPNGSGSYTWDSGLTPGGTYTLTETPASGWVSDFVSCTGATQVSEIANGVQFVAPAGASVDCSFTNTKRPTVKVSKSSTGGNGTFEFELEGVDGAGGGSKQDVATAPNGSGSYTWESGLTPGGTYTLTETPASGWVSDFVSCTGATQVSEIANGVQFVAPAGASVDCSFTNTKRPTITVKKTTAGKDGVFDFTLTGTGGSTKQLDSSSTNTVAWGPDGLEPGGDYTLTEATLPDYEQAFLSCVNTATDPPSSIGTSLPEQVGVSLTDVPAGATIECSFVNSNRPTVQVSKGAVGDDGVFEFTLTGPGGSAKDVAVGDGGTNTATWDTGLTVDGAYTLTETSKSDWVQAFLGCTNLTTGQAIGTPTPEGVGVSFTAPAGARIVCSFTNTKRPTVTVEKIVHGGSGLFDFTLDGPGGSTKVWDTEQKPAPAVTWDEGLTPDAAYTLVEDPAEGWKGYFIECTADDAPIGTALEDQIGVEFVAPAGAAIECQFVNTQDPRIIVEKELDGLPTEGWQYDLSLPADGTARFLPDHTLTTTGVTGAGGSIEFEITPLPVDGSGVEVTIDEVAQPGVSFVGVKCAAGLVEGGSTVDREPASIDPAAASAVIEVKAGEAVRCVFANSTIEVGGTSVRRSLPFTGTPADLLLKAALGLVAIGVMILLMSWIVERRRKVANPAA